MVRIGVSERMKWKVVASSLCHKSTGGPRHCQDAASRRKAGAQVPRYLFPTHISTPRHSYHSPQDAITQLTNPLVVTTQSTCLSSHMSTVREPSSAFDN